MSVNHKKIITSAPMRITIVGGGTDIPEYFTGRGALLLSCALTARILVSVYPRSDGRYSLNGDNLIAEDGIVEQVKTYTAYIIKSSGVSGADISVQSPVRPGSGMGGSGTYTVALLAALTKISGQTLGDHELALQAFNIERSYFGSFCGVQDQLVAAYGSVLQIDISKEGQITVKQDFDKAQHMNNILEDHVLFIDSGISRVSHNELNKITKKFSVNDSYHTTTIFNMSNKFQEYSIIICREDIGALGKLWTEHWKNKRTLSDSMTTNEVDKIFAICEKFGVFGGKLLGAGGGGIIAALFPKDSRSSAREELSKEGFGSFIWSLSQKGLVYEEASLADRLNHQTN